MKSQFRVRHGEWFIGYRGALKFDPKVRIVPANDPATPEAQCANTSRAGIKYRGQETATVRPARMLKLAPKAKEFVKDLHFEFALQTADGKQYLQRHGTREGLAPKMRKKQRRAARLGAKQMAERAAA
jgi:hypothetical protein